MLHASFVRCARLCVTVAMLVTAAAAPTSAQAATEDRAQHLQDRAEALRAEVAEVRAQVGRLSAAVEAQRSAVAEATAAQVAADAALVEARKARSDARQALAEHRARVRRLAAAAYVRGPAALEGVLQSATINDAVRRHAMATAAADASTKILEDLAAAEEHAERAEEAQAAAAADASAAADAAIREHASLEREVRAQTELLAAVSDRLEHNLSEAAALRQIDEDAAAVVATVDGELVAVLPGAPAAPSAPVAGSPPQPLRPPPTVATVRIRGIRIAEAIAPQVEALLMAAEASGILLGGGGYRDPAQQIALRIAHCGPTDFDVYEKPSNECTPPTARPGTSMHERGLAIDFTVGGRAIATEDDPAFRWLAANASSFGLVNLPEEPWHWSTTGR